jgi:hypothetical protein
MKWRYITGFEGRYEVSETGLVRNSRTECLLKGVRYPNGYLGVQLGRGKTYLRHRLVAAAFVPGDTSLQVNHLDGDRANNTASNLEWVTCGENHKHSYRELSRKRHALTRAVKLFKSELALTFASGLAAARYLGVSAGSIASTATKQHRCKGFEVTYV